MHNAKLICLFMAFSYFSTLLGQTETEWSVSIDFSEIKEVFFRIPCQSNENLQELTKIISIDHVHPSEWIYAYANEKEFRSFLNLCIDYEVLQHPGTLHHPLMKSEVNIRQVEAWDFYPTYDAYLEIMYQFEELYPDLCEAFSIGKTVEERDLLFAKLSGTGRKNEFKPRFLYTATMHGDETAGYVLMLHLIDYLLKNYGSDDQITHLLDHLEIWINPLANPDGTYAGGNETVYGATRNNANGINLNRNYPDPEDGPNPDGNEWQAETVAFMALADSISFVMGANFHGGAEVFNYPWDTWPQLHADDNWWQYVGREWADTSQFYSPAGYFTDLNNGITNGYAWYTINGGRQDYMNYFHHCREVTLEISNSKLLSESELEPFWEYNYRSFLHYMEQALFGVAGTISDSITGKKLVATVTIANHDTDNSWVISDSLNGHYYRLLYAGNYDLTFSSPGYQNKTIENVQVENRHRVILDVHLVSENADISNHPMSGFFDFSPNPFSDQLLINFNGPQHMNCRIELFNLTGKRLLKEQFSFSPDRSGFRINVNERSPGIYLLRLTSGKLILSQKLIKK